ncbi:hypothetical protein ACFOEK_10795 [Litoribrevibacter euphylliae]|uniref:Uncharacterized protein n=1 Tax=Litoribrevibacter euphylliae TaxID=1834034 RepID=A0ABV7HCD0_9GAMM
MSIRNIKEKIIERLQVAAGVVLGLAFFAFALFVDAVPYLAARWLMGG